ncbi:hypothetical protein GZL_06117 [Streptomyces sp. 769]|nr:hypothetical protein GZL_06117 [Streptomyces sp. 769]
MCRAVFHRVPSHWDTSPLPMGNHPLGEGAERADSCGRPNRNHTPISKRPGVRLRSGRWGSADAPIPCAGAIPSRVPHIPGTMLWCVSLHGVLVRGGPRRRARRSSPFRRSRSPGTCAIRPARVDYAQCSAHARGPRVFSET